MEVITPEQINNIRKEMNKAYSSKKELEQAMDDLMYKLFFIEGDCFDQNEIRNSASLVHHLKKAIK